MKSRGVEFLRSKVTAESVERVLKTNFLNYPAVRHRRAIQCSSAVSCFNFTTANNKANALGSLRELRH